jgi:hypothetical protein
LHLSLFILFFSKPAALLLIFTRYVEKEAEIWTRKTFFGMPCPLQAKRRIVLCG